MQRAVAAFACGYRRSSRSSLLGSRVKEQRFSWSSCNKFHDASFHLVSDNDGYEERVDPFSLVADELSVLGNRLRSMVSMEENDGDHVPCTKSSNQVVDTSLGSTRHMASLSAEGSTSASSSSSEMISVTFVDKNGDEKSIKVPLGMSMLEAAHQNDIELEGACEGSLACSTCHVIVMDEKFYNKLPEPTDEENDMLDLAFGLTERSRLGCQVLAKPELDGIRLAIPSATRNFAVDGYVPKPH